MLNHTINLPGGYYFAAKHIRELRPKDIVSLNTQLFGPRLSPSKVYGLLKTWAGSTFSGILLVSLWTTWALRVFSPSGSWVFTQSYTMETSKFSSWLAFSTEEAWASEIQTKASWVTPEITQAPIYTFSTPEIYSSTGKTEISCLVTSSLLLLLLLSRFSHVRLCATP